MGGWIRSTGIQKDLRVRLLILHVGRNQLTWSGHLPRMSVFWASEENLGKTWDVFAYISQLAMGLLEFPLEELVKLAG